MKFILAIVFVIFAACVLQSRAQPSICVKYAALLNLTQTTLVNSVVVGTFMNVTANGTPTQRDFNGSLTNTTDYITNTTAQGILVTGLVNFFGALLGCTTTANYTGPSNMVLVHQYLIIDNATFEYFNNALLGVMAGAGVNATDLANVAAVLESFRSSICNQPDCVAMLTTNGMTTGNMTSVNATTGAITSAPLTTGHMSTTSPLTTRAITTGQITSQLLTTNPLTTAQKAGATGLVVSIIAVLFAALIALF